MSNKSMTFEVAQQRFLDQGRTDVELCKDGYVGWRKKSKFFDKKVNDYFWCMPDKVYRRKSVHPKRRMEKRTKTNLEKYGCEQFLSSNFAKEQIKKTCLEKFGVDNPFKSKLVRDKAKQTNLKNFGVEYAAQSEIIKEKTKKTNIKNFGVDYYLLTDEAKEKIAKTNTEKYGFHSPAMSQIVKQKILNTNLKNFGVENYKKYKCKKILETDEILIDWYGKQSEPKPSITTIYRYYRKQEKIKICDLNLFFKNYKSNKSTLELLTENLFNISHYNCKVPNTNLHYKPDFKLSETVYLNVDGLYWHSEEQKDKDYHFNLRKEFQDNGLTIFQFYENEIKNKPEIVKSIINNELGRNKNKINIKDCTIKHINNSSAKQFLIENHLEGSINSKHIGLYYNDILVSLLSYKEVKNICKIERFCILNDYNIVGSFFQLLNYLQYNLLKPSTTEVHILIDLRYNTGKQLEENDFKLIKETLDWKWTNGRKIFDKTLNNEKIQELKLYKIYDAGQGLYVKEITKTCL